ncbi:MAG: twin-arginine translocase TatA/TatE family subunit [Candidatus Omnitrophica bacterium]|nr:twin-arginine translocase TatA/TatE family subunit [Candidatus Omnitrophota bacterium]MCK5393626.1 twin-arginine translocase TatA/TatE family subunit [Candidatus Omnitrophota bacterium]MCK5493593.1 twin-arginine translocase TatA/TatE family subunit [Candidatus Omnitrophota bacterium]
MLSFGMNELIVILLIALLFFGSTKLPQVAKALGRSIKEFKKGAKEVKDEIEEETNDDDEKKKT